ncbi:MAG: GtrA family protein [Alphaproteobacteria bacterium]|nr:GtrA family protein [Alphaproteobacteria bacterium]
MNLIAKPTALQQPIAILDGEFQRYFLVSLTALAIDASLLLLLTSVGDLHFLAANANAFLAGSLAAYLGSVAWVFRHRRFGQGALEVPVFIAIGLAGLLVNETVLWTAASGNGQPLEIAKALAAAASFGFNFVMRKLLSGFSRYETLGSAVG